MILSLRCKISNTCAYLSSRKTLSKGQLHFVDQTEDGPEEVAACKAAMQFGLVAANENCSLAHRVHMRCNPRD